MRENRSNSCFQRWFEQPESARIQQAMPKLSTLISQKGPVQFPYNWYFHDQHILSIHAVPLIALGSQCTLFRAVCAATFPFHPSERARAPMVDLPDLPDLPRYFFIALFGISVHRVVQNVTGAILSWARIPGYPGSLPTHCHSAIYSTLYIQPREVTTLTYTHRKLLQDP